MVAYVQLVEMPSGSYLELMTAKERRAVQIREAIDLRNKFIQTYGVEHAAIERLNEAIQRLKEDVDGLDESTDDFFKSMSDEIASSIKDWQGWGSFVGNFLANLIEKYGEQFFSAIFTLGAQSGTDLGTLAGNLITGHGSSPVDGQSSISSTPKLNVSKVAATVSSQIPNLPKQSGFAGQKASHVQAGGNVEVHIHENAATGQHRVQKSGGRIDVFLKKAVTDVIGSGGADNALRDRFGVKPNPKGA